LKPEHILHFDVNRTRYVEAIRTLNASTQLIPVQTPYSNLFLANTGQVYPALPTSETAITHARDVATLTLDSLRSNAA
jgi:hypothetical protein